MNTARSTWSYDAPTTHIDFGNLQEDDDPMADYWFGKRSSRPFWAVISTRALHYGSGSRLRELEHKGDARCPLHRPGTNLF